MKRWMIRRRDEQIWCRTGEVWDGEAVLSEEKWGGWLCFGVKCVENKREEFGYGF
jgi:hypothetical protein